MSRVANRYGKALFQIALENNKIDRVGSDLNMIRDIIKSNVEFRSMLLNPLIPEAKKSIILEKLFREKVDPLTYHFLILLCTKKRSNILSEVIDRFYVLLYDHKGILRGKIISAQQLSADQVERINKNITVITGKSVELELETDSNLLAGFVVKIKDTVIDISVKNQLEKLREKLVYG